jgi:tetratricopeptide (TPR) repeat protein
LLLRAVALQPSYAQAHHTLGVTEVDAGWPLRALPHFERAAQLQPLSPAPVERLANTQVIAGRLDDAIATAKRAIATDPTFPNGYWQLGVAGYAAGDLTRAVTGYRDALSRQPRRPYLWLELASLCLDLGRADEAAADYARAIEQLPGVAWPAIHAAQAWLLQAERTTVPPALEAMPQDGSVAEWARIRVMAGLAVDGTALLRALDAAQARGDPLAPIPWFAFQGHHRTLDLAMVHAHLGQTAQAAQRLDAAAAQLDAFERQGNRWHTIAFHRARIHALRGEVAPALDALTAAVAAGWRRGWWIALDPSFAAVRAQPRCTALLQDVAARVAVQRRELGWP